MEKKQTINTLCDFIKEIPIVEGIVARVSKFNDNTIENALLIFTNDDSEFIKKTTGIDFFSDSSVIESEISDLLFSKRSYDGFCETPDIVPSPSDIAAARYDKGAIEAINSAVDTLSSTLKRIKAKEKENFKRTINEYNEKLSKIIKQIEEKGIKVKINPFCERLRRDKCYYFINESYKSLSYEHSIVYDLENKIRLVSRDEYEEKELRSMIYVMR